MSDHQKEAILKCRSCFYLKYSHQYFEVCWVFHLKNWIKLLGLWQWKKRFAEGPMKANMRFLKSARLRISYIGIFVVPFNYSWREEIIFKMVKFNSKEEYFLVICACLEVGIN